MTLCIQIGHAQNTLSVTIDSAKGKFIPTGVRVGVETINIIRTFNDSDLTEYTFLADIDFHRYFLSLEYGRLDRTRQDQFGSVYNINGSYFRVGPDINFLKKDPDRNALYFGLRYAWTTLDDELTFVPPSNFFQNETQVISNSGLTANWYEMVTGLKVKIWKTFWLGYTARFRFGVDTFEQNELIPHEIPGYGRADERVTWGFDYWLMFRIPVRKQPAVVFQSK